MCLGSAKSTSRYDDEHVMGPRPVRRKARASERPISRHEIEHGTISKKSKPRPKYVYGPKGDIVGEQLTDSQSAEREVRGAIRNSRGSAPGRSRYDDEHIIRSPRDLPAAYTAPNELGGSYTHGMAGSVSLYHDEHVIGSEPSGRGKGKGLAKEEDVMELNGSVDLTSKHDDEHFVLSKNVGGTSSGADAVLAMFSGERRIGEKLDGRRYGPGPYLSGKASSKPKREAERKSMSKRPKEYGF